MMPNRKHVSTRSCPSRYRSEGLWLLVSSLALLPACRSKPKNFDNENDDVGRRLLEAESQVESLTAQRNELAVKVDELSRVAASGGQGVAADVIAAMPRCAGIEIDGLSGPADRDGVLGFDVVEVAVKPFDGRQRFVQVAGTLTVEAVLLPPVAVAEAGIGPRVLGRVTLTPADLREAYRSSLMGTHYSVAVPIEPANGAIEGTLLMRASFQDGLSGARYEAEQSRALTPAPAGTVVGPGGPI